MSDDERIERLTALARRVPEWADSHASATCGSLPAGYDYAMVHTFHPGNFSNTPIKIVHPRSLDALEAALLVLQPMVRDICDGEHEGPCPAWHDGEIPAWVEQLAAKWEREAACLEDEQPHDRTEADWLRRHAAELRERAKGGERG